jgi:hypothetical protein
MANPPIFQPGFNYSNWQATNPIKPLPAQQVDNDFANAARSINQAISAIGDVRRSDGKLKNGIVGPDALAPQFSLGFSFEGTWADGVEYQAGDGVVFAQTFYAARASHTSSVANQPPDDDTWTLLFSLDDIVVSGALSMPVATFLSDGATTAFDLGFFPVSNRNVFVTIGGQIQDPSEYTINGSVLTFVNGAPPTGPLGEAYSIVARAFATTGTLVIPEDGSVTDAKLSPAVASKLNSAMQPATYNPQLVFNMADRAAMKAADTTKFKTFFLQEAGREGLFKWTTGDFTALVAADTAEAVYIKSTAVAASVGALVRQNVTEANLKWFGAVGDYATFDTVAIKAWLAFFAATGVPLFAPKGVYRCADNVVFPKGIIIRGIGSAKIGTFPQYDLYNKSNLRPGYKTLIGGSNIIFSGTPTTTVAGFGNGIVNAKPMVLYDNLAPCDISGISFIQDMDVYDAGGSLTTKATDNRAANYTHGMLHRGTLSRFNDVTIFGYFFTSGGQPKARGFVHANVAGDDGGIGNDPDYPKFISCYISSGVLITGEATAQPEGNTGTEWIGTNFFGCDHHTRADSDPNIPSLNIDVFLSTTQQGRGHSFSSCSFRTCADTAISFDHCSDLLFANAVTEFSQVAGVPGLSNQGVFIGTSNTANVTIAGIAGSGTLGLDALRMTIGRNLTVVGETNGRGGAFYPTRTWGYIAGSTLTVASGVIAPTSSYHPIDSTGNPNITSMDLSGIKDLEFITHTRSGSGAITITEGNNISLRKGWGTLTLDAASDTVVFQKRGSNAFLISETASGGSTDRREIPQLIVRSFVLSVPILSSGGNGSTQTVSFPEAVFGDGFETLGASVSLQGMHTHCAISAAGSVQLRFMNSTGSATTAITDATFTVYLIKRGNS